MAEQVGLSTAATETLQTAITICPARRSQLSLQGDDQADQSANHDRHGQKLADVHGRPAPAAGVLGEHDGVGIGRPIGVELGDQDVQELPHEQQRGG